MDIIRIKSKLPNTHFAPSFDIRMGAFQFDNQRVYERIHDFLLDKESDILDGKVKNLNTDNISAKYALTTALCYELKEAFDNDNKGNEKFDNFLDFMQNNFESEMVVMGATVALSKYGIRPKFNQLKNYKPFIQQYGKLIEQA